MIGFLIGFTIGYLVARNQDTLLALLKRKVETDLLPPKDPPPRA